MGIDLCGIIPYQDTMKKIAFLFISFLAWTTLMAASSPVAIEESRLIVSTDAWSTETVRVKITSSDGISILDEELVATTSERVVDLSKLPAKQYTLTVENRYKVQLATFAIAASGDQQVVSIETFYKPMGYVRGRELHLAFDTPDRPVTIRIYDEHAQRVKTYELPAGDINTVIALRRLKRGKYVALISNGLVQQAIPFER